ncbi:SDR family NAD(P)-dependent oxidoreductase [Rhodospirillales bacterium]|nr:SDR family NAD(P)-dependent oxidoreductase [Rhodospirillales bacterium]
MTSSSFQSVLITGGSSGIGLAVAKELAAPGVFITITGRDTDRLSQVSSELSERGANVISTQCDVTDSLAMKNLTIDADARAPLDLVIANAGISGGGAPSQSHHDKARSIMQTNVLGVMNTVQPATDLMTSRKVGRIAIVSSLAGFRGLPTAPAYSASKVAVKAWGDAIRPGLRENGVGLSMIYPGFVKSRITDQNDFPMPFFMPAEQAAKIIVSGLMKGKDSIAFPWPTVLMMKMLSALPASIFDRIMAKGPKKI